MRKLTTWSLGAAALLAMALLAGCDAERIAKLEEGVATEADVRKQFGEPVTIVTAADGTRTFEYPRQPEGWTNYFITIGPDGKMSSLRQVLRDGNFAKVQPGMDKMELRNLLGRPAKTITYQNKQEEVWDWRYMDGQTSKFFSVTMDMGGKVVSTARLDDPRGTTDGPNR
jgi:outer membrane protein assembly factor BamE (lipoprotein component of BamABCDE complex)